LHPGEKSSPTPRPSGRGSSEVAYTSKADCLITFDKDLLELRNENKELEIKEHKFKILKPIEFLKIYASK